jgi:hypothetical protein
LKKQERTAVGAVAGRFSATWEEGGDRHDAYLIAAGRRVAVDIRTLKAGKGTAAKPRLRFDRVATRLMERLHATLGQTVPDGVTVLVTVTAPIRLASKTTAALEDKIQILLGRGPAGRDESDTIHGNRVLIRVVRGGGERAPKTIGFVHNSDSDPLLLLKMTSELLEIIGGRGSKRSSNVAGERWLVTISAGGVSCLDAYRYICSQLRGATDFEKILMVFGDGRVEVLAE